MSYIDSFRHELVGLFASRIPVYRPLEVIEGSESHPQDFACRPDQLVIGGGAGEHPGVVIRDPEAAVAKWACEQAAQFVDETMRHDWLQASARFADQSAVSFPGWDREMLADFVKRCRGDSLNYPFRGNKQGFESWLARSVGEFVFYALPDLAPNIIHGLTGRESFYPDHLGQGYRNILLLPPLIPIRDELKLDRAPAERNKTGIIAWSITRRHRLDG
ncbi:MAG: hypothetical protein AAF346_08010 [Pseudomonadota bacterium]